MLSVSSCLWHFINNMNIYILVVAESQVFFIGCLAPGAAAFSVRVDVSLLSSAVEKEDSPACTEIPSWEPLI